MKLKQNPENISQKKFHYISPWIYPVMPSESGPTVVSHDLNILLYDAQPLLDDNECVLTLELWYQGEVISSEIIEVAIKDKVVTPAFVNREYVLDGFGFLQMALECKEAYFRKLELEKGYALLMRPGGGATTVIPQAKYADLIIIQNMRRTGTFCLVHPGHYIDSATDSGNSAFLVNPYEGPLVAKLVNQNGKVIKKKILPGHAELISLAPLLVDKEPACIMYSGSNRFPGWDVRHSLSDVRNIKHVDHLEYFRPSRTFDKLTDVAFIKSRVKYKLRGLGYIT
jgi:hypothetical protein